MNEADLNELSPFHRDHLEPELVRAFKLNGRVERDRCFLEAVFEVILLEVTDYEYEFFKPSGMARRLQHIIHLPGLRGNPERTYPRTAVGPEFPGTFENYTASVVAHWSEAADGRLAQLAEHLNTLGLASTIVARPVDDSSVELQVSRLPSAKKASARDLVNIADVGFGVSQTLPLLVALLAAEKGQLVYVEQPEIHLHPRAQVALATVLTSAVGRGVRVVAETHSSLLLLGVQRLVAEGKLGADDVRLHWFERDGKTGATTITPGQLDAAGRFGSWPADFDDVAMAAQFAYLNASQEKLARP